MTLSHVKTVDTTLDKELETHAHRIKVSWQDYKLKLVNVYAPPQGMYRSALFKKLGGLITRDCVSCGDWNCVPDVAKDVKSGSAEPYANIGGRLLNEFMEERNLLDSPPPRREKTTQDREPFGARPKSRVLRCPA